MKGDTTIFMEKEVNFHKLNVLFIDSQPLGFTSRP